MWYSVSLHKKGNASALECFKATEAELPELMGRGYLLAQKEQSNILVTIKPAEHVYEIPYVEKQCDFQPPREQTQGYSPSVIEHCNTGD